MTLKILPFVILFVSAVLACPASTPNKTISDLQVSRQANTAGYQTNLRSTQTNREQERQPVGILQSSLPQSTVQPSHTADGIIAIALLMGLFACIHLWNKRSSKPRNKPG